MEKLDHGMDDAAHALNKAALIASDAGMADMARALCWQHISAYLTAERPLTFTEARYMLEPVINLARLDIRSEQGQSAVTALKAVHRAVTERTDLVIDGRTLPTAILTGEQAERRRMVEWVWLQLLGEGIRALTMANRWADAADHALAYRGVGTHLTEGRQALIIAQCAVGDPAEANKILASSVLTQPWEQQVASCLQLMCSPPDATRVKDHLATAMRRLATAPPAANYASYRARLGLTVTILAHGIWPEAATGLLHRTAALAINSTDGYAARDVLGFREPIEGITHDQITDLQNISRRAGLAVLHLPEAVLNRISRAADSAAKIIEIGLKSARR
ncbi:hypothetical protein ACFQY4_35055 [Catellatospora bangladeshensis]|uniref:hypothetical protein n=1 Tax=Catellatospora bangladeshensis TaxID=310355 RepID=UPI00360A89A3